MLYLQIFFAAAALVYVYVQSLDAKATVASYSKGGFEGNQLITGIYGNRPTLRQLYTFNLVEYVILFTPFWAVNLFTTGHNPVCGGLALAVSVARPISAYLGVREWAKWEKS